MRIVLTRPTTRRRFTAVASAAAVMVLLTAGSAFAGPTPPIISQSTAQALKVQLLPPAVTVAQSPTPTTAVNTGSPATINNVNPAIINLPSPILGILNVGTPNNQGVVVGALSEDTEADNSGGNGTSFACAGTVQQGGAVRIGPANQQCSGAAPPRWSNPPNIPDPGHRSRPERSG